MNTIQISSFVASLITMSANALAQGYTMQPVPTAPAPLVPVSTPMAVEPATDHAAVVGHLAVGYMGVQDVTMAATSGTSTVTLKAPVVGVRYWLNDKIGLDAGLGLAVKGGSKTTTVVNTANTTDEPGAFAFVFHAGLPYVLTAKKHYSFQVIPELNVGFASQTEASTTTSDLDKKYSGLRLDIGARAGAEIQFGFIGVPNLALQGSVGAFFKYAHTGYSTKDLAINTSSTSIGTSVGDKPWDIFTGNVSALYYF